MNTLVDPIYLYILLILFIILTIFFFFKQSHYQRDALELNHDLTQTKEQLQTLSAKYETLVFDKQKIEQFAVQQQTLNEANLGKLAEKEQQLGKLAEQISLAEQQEDQLERYINELKERVGSSQAKAESVEEQLQANALQMAEKERENQRLSAELNSCLQELTKIRVTLNEKQANFEEQQRAFVEMKQQMNVEFQHLAQQILEEKSKTFAQSNQTSLDLLLKPFKEQIENFQKRVNEVHTEAVKGNTNLEAEIRKVLEIGNTMSKEAQNLTTALKGNNKVAGNWGEMQLETALQAAGLLADVHYVAQESFKDMEGSRFNPDFVLHLPDNKHLVLDSKVSLLDYEQAVSSEEKSAILEALNAHCRSLKTHIDGLAKKNYNNLKGVNSPDFVLMFVPIEAAYIEAMKHDPQLFEYGYKKNVILVSHTTLMPILRTVANLWRIERGNAEAREISQKAGEIYNQVFIIADRLNKLGGSLRTATKHYNDSVTSIVGKQGLLGKVERFKAFSSKVEQSLPELELATDEPEFFRLEAVLNDTETRIEHKND